MNSLLEGLNELEMDPRENVQNNENPRRSTRQRTSTSFGSDFVKFLIENEPQYLKKRYRL